MPATKKAAKKKAPTNKSPRKGKKQELSRKEKLEMHLQTINSAYKAIVMQTADEFETNFVLRRPTGITSLDLAIAGGFPAGGLSEIVGSASVGKDYLVNRVIANLQANYGDDTAVCLAMTEMHYDKKYAKKCGVRIPLTQKEIDDWQRALGRNFTQEEMAWALDEVGTIHEVIADNAEQLLEIVAQNVASNLYQVIVVNSFGALLTKAEEEAKGGIEDKHYGGASGAITSFAHRLHAALNRPDDFGESNLTTVIGINQYRDNVGPDARWRPLKVSGGNALKHAKLVSVFLDDRARIKQTVQNRVNILGKEIHWEILKQKAGGHDGPRGSYPFYFGESGFPFGADVYQDLIITAVQLGIIQMAGAWLSYQDEHYDLRGQGKERFAHEIANADGAFEHIRKKCFDAAGVNFILRESDGE